MRECLCHRFSMKSVLKEPQKQTPKLQRNREWRYYSSRYKNVPNWRLDCESTRRGGAKRTRRCPQRYGVELQWWQNLKVILILGSWFFYLTSREIKDIIYYSKECDSGDIEHRKLQGGQSAAMLAQFSWLFHSPRPANDQFLPLS